MSSLYITDLDGTLLRDDGTLSPRTVDILKELVSNGAMVTTASARSVASIQDIFKDVKLPLPVIEFNGAIISDLETGEHLVVNCIARSLVEKLSSTISKHGCSPFVSTFAGTEDRLYYSSVTHEGVKWYLNDRLAHNDERLRFVDDIAESFNDTVICLNVIGRLDVLAALESELRDKFTDLLEIHCLEDTYSPGFYWLTAHDRNATKDRAIKKLQQMMNLSEREVIVFGDNANDIRMFRSSDRSIAVSNAIEGLKKHATEVIGSNNDDSVALYIKSDFYPSELKT